MPEMIVSCLKPFHSIFIYFLVVLVTRSIVASERVFIDISQNTARIGDSFTIKCTIKEVNVNTMLANFLSCPFNKRVDYCLKNCENYCLAINSNCDELQRSMINYRCSREISDKTIVYSYRIEPLTQSIVAGRDNLTFSCTFKGIVVTQKLAIIATSKPQGPDKIPLVINVKPKTTTTTKERTFLGAAGINLTVRDIVIISLCAILLVSLIINIWCSINCCIHRHCRNRRNRRDANQFRSTTDNQNRKPCQSFPCRRTNSGNDLDGMEMMPPHPESDIRLNMCPSSATPVPSMFQMSNSKKAFSNPSISHNPNNTANRQSPHANSSHQFIPLRNGGSLVYHPTSMQRPPISIPGNLSPEQLQQSTLQHTPSISGSINQMYDYNQRFVPIPMHIIEQNPHLLLPENPIYQFPISPNYNYNVNNHNNNLHPNNLNDNSSNIDSGSSHLM